MTKYVCKRKDVCCGQLIKKIFLDSTDSFSDHIVCRSILYQKDKYGLGDDLVYTVPISYPIVGTEYSNNDNFNFLINNYVELDEILKYLKFNEDLTQKDLNKIYRQLITKKDWIKRNQHLFGYDIKRQEEQLFKEEIYDKLIAINQTLSDERGKQEHWVDLVKKTGLH